MSRISLIKRDQQERPNSWKNFKKHIAVLITEALLMLRQRDDLVKCELELNRLFYLCLMEATHKLTESEPTFNLPLPAYDGRNPPHLKDKQKAKREDSRPDIYWTLMDHGANYPDWCRTFALEGKRLGEPTSRTWVLNKQYVTDGILRFFQEDKGYGKGCEVGAMVGYIQNKSFDEILDEVNSHITAYECSIPLLVLSDGGWKDQGVSHLSHTFQRSYIPLQFFLQHFWVDMKDCFYLSRSDDAEEVGIEEENAVLNEEPGRKQEKKKRKRKTKKALESEKVSQAALQMELPLRDTDSATPTSQDNLEFKNQGIG